MTTGMILLTIYIVGMVAGMVVVGARAAAKKKLSDWDYRKYTENQIGYDVLYVMVWPLPIGLMAIASPFYGLYKLGFFFSWCVDKRKERKARKLVEKEQRTMNERLCRWD